MPVTRSNLLAFGAGLAAGAAAYATYPRWKGRVAPLVNAVVEGASTAFRDAQAAAHPDPAGHADAGPRPWVPAGRNGSCDASPTHL